MPIDAAGNEIATADCACGRKRRADKPKCCVLCDGREGIRRSSHTVECSMQMALIRPKQRIEPPALTHSELHRQRRAK